MITMNELVDLRRQQHFAQELYRQQIMQRIPDPFAALLPLPMQQRVFMPPRPTLPGLEAKLENQDLWQQFHKIGTEMIITKTGRRMFPSMRVSLSGLEEETNYCVLVEMVPIGDCRYKFSGSQWVPAGGAEPQSPQRMCLHPDSPAAGSHWQAQPILFNKVKLTNNTLDNNGHVVLASMHKYQPRIHVIRTSDLTQIPWAPQQAFVFPETEFVAVTAYQNDRITKLKIDYNPFAKGFRESGQARCKRKMSSSSSSTSPTLDEQQQQQYQQTSTDDCHSIASYESPPIKRLRSNGSANSHTSLDEAAPNLYTSNISTDCCSPTPLAMLDTSAAPLRYMNTMEANLRLLELSRPFYMHPPAATHNSIFPPMAAQQLLFQSQNNYSGRDFHLLDSSLEPTSSYADESESLSSASEEPCKDIFVDVVSTSTAADEHQVENDHDGVDVDNGHGDGDGAITCETPVIAAERISFSISSILGGRNVVAV